MILEQSMKRMALTLGKLLKWKQIMYISVDFFASAYELMAFIANKYCFNSVGNDRLLRQEINNLRV